MAERKRRDEEPADELLDEELYDDAVDDDADDFDDTEVDDDDVAVSRGRRGTATKARTKADKPVKKDTARIGIFGRIIRFVREVVAELRKVIWPTRKELITYATVVVVFVTVMLALLFVLDQSFARLVLWVFGESN